MTSYQEEQGLFRLPVDQKRQRQRQRQEQRRHPQQQQQSSQGQRRTNPKYLKKQMEQSQCPPPSQATTTTTYSLELLEEGIGPKPDRLQRNHRNSKKKKRHHPTIVISPTTVTSTVTMESTMTPSPGQETTASRHEVTNNREEEFEQQYQQQHQQQQRVRREENNDVNHSLRSQYHVANASRPNDRSDLQVVEDIDNNDNEDDDQDYQEYIRKWKESPFAIGRSYTTWQEEKAVCCMSLRFCLLKYGCYRSCCCDCETPTVIQHRLRAQQQQEQQQYNQPRRYHYSKNKSIVACTAWICKYTSFPRVGNMIVLYQTIPARSSQLQSEDDPSPSLQRTRPQLYIVLGPYWMIALFVTFPIMMILSIWTAVVKIQFHVHWVQWTWLVSTIMMIFTFLLVACTNPGIQYRYHTKPQQHHDRNHPAMTPSEINQSIDHDPNNSSNINNNTEWVWNDQAYTYRLSTAKYDPECAVVIDQLHHVCPWTGTAVGKNNIYYFRLFMISVLVNVVYNLLLLAAVMKQYKNHST
jgi:DHHC palmitoyltransferase